MKPTRMSSSFWCLVSVVRETSKPLNTDKNGQENQHKSTSRREKLSDLATHYVLVDVQTSWTKVKTEIVSTIFTEISCFIWSYVILVDGID